MRPLNNAQLVISWWPIVAPTGVATLLLTGRTACALFLRLVFQVLAGRLQWEHPVLAQFSAAILRNSRVLPAQG